MPKSKFGPPYFVNYVPGDWQTVHHRILRKCALDEKVPVIENDQHSGIQTFANELRQCVTVMEQPEQWCTCGRKYIIKKWDLNK